jgi:ubiquinone biosynthesis protein
MSSSFNSEGLEVHPSTAFDGPPEEEAPRPLSDTRAPSKVSRARIRRREKIQLAADEALERWQKFAGSTEPVQRPLPRPWRLTYKGDGLESAILPRWQEVPFEAGFFQAAARLRLWIYGAIWFVFGVIGLWFSRRNTEKERAILMRKTFLKLGTTFIKFGQQLSMRRDLLPQAYTDELETLLDKVDIPLPPDEALDIIEKAIGKKRGVQRVPHQEIFAAFDTEQVGSASVACVYHAVLRTGEHVAVKVRRPGITTQLAADMRALKWLVSLFEVFFLPPRFLNHFNHELRTMLMDELDFRKEARFAELYRRRIRKTRQMRFVSVPRVFFDYSDDEVMVSEYVSGVWLRDILTAMRTNENEVRDLMDRMRVDPLVLARRIQLIARFNNFENYFFHADLHPANILIQPGNKICLIDFGSCGSFSNRELNAWRRWFDAQSVDDVGGMVQAALAIIEPLPLIDKDEFGARLEAEFWKSLYAIKSKHADWSERITSRLWFGFLKLCQEFKIPMRLNTLRMIRASMLTDTIAGQLDPDQDPYREFRYYEKGAGKRAKKRLGKRVGSLLGPSKFIRLELGVETFLQTLFQVQRVVGSLAGIRIGAIITKIDDFLSLLMRHLAWIGLTASVSTVVLWALTRMGRVRKLSPVFEGNENLRLFIGLWGTDSLFGAFLKVVTSGWWLVIAFTPTVIVLLRIYRRTGEKTYPRGAGAIDDI